MTPGCLCKLSTKDHLYTRAEARGDQWIMSISDRHRGPLLNGNDIMIVVATPKVKDSFGLYDTFCVTAHGPGWVILADNEVELDSPD